MSEKMQQPPIDFDCVKTPLTRGVNLIEASAGTGKTFAVAMLVLRAVTEENIELERILVVTYTKAAAAELRDRIRERLLAARDLLEGRIKADDDRLKNDVLPEWYNSFKDDEKKKKLFLGRLKVAMSEIDRVSVFTIHGFCQRMLQEQALEARQLFDLELLPSLDDFYKRSSEQFWRKEVYPLSTWQCSLVLEKFREPSELFKLYLNVTDKNAIFEPKLPALETLWAQLEKSIAAIRSWWQVNGEAFALKMQECVEQKLKVKHIEHIQNALASLIAFCDKTSPNFPVKLEWLQEDKIRGELNSRKVKKADVDEYVAGLGIPDKELCQLSQNHKELLVGFQLSGFNAIQERVDILLEQEGAVSFDQLISSLANCLKGEGGEDLKTLLQNRFHFALIDEFQDTDSAQWHIFSTVFNQGSHWLYLIGDPKQAIYKFRGADINSYFSACRQANHYYSLGKNFRSHPVLVEAINKLFLSRENPFLFEDMGVGYQSVSSAKDGSTFLCKKDKTALSPFSYYQLEMAVSKSGKPASWPSGDADRVILKNIVQQCLELLDNEDGAYICSELDGEICLKEVLPKDIAILVLSHKQASDYQKALVSYGVPAVIAGKKSVYETVECQELLLLLKGILEFENLQCIKSAMTSSLFALTGAQLYQLWGDDAAVADWYNLFMECNRLWHDKGVLQMLYYLVNEKALFSNLAELPFAERRIANYSHLFELLQEAETDNNFGPNQTLLWLSNCFNNGEKGENVELRLESDENAVQIVTIHSSKGLQYPIVFCPDSYKRKAFLKHEKNVISCFDNYSVIDFGSPKFEERRELARKEELAEDLRLLYVALTRAELCCYCFWADSSASSTSIDKSVNSALSYLLFDFQKIPYEEQQEKLSSLGSPVIEIGNVDEITGYYSPVLNDSEIKPRQVSERSLKTDWQVTSYSGLASLSDHSDIITSFKSESVESGNQTDFTLYSTLPKGAHFGNSVHDVLEELSFQEIAKGPESLELMDLVEKKCDHYGVDGDESLLVEMLEKVVTAPLSVDGSNSFSLSSLDDAKCLKEMEFYLRLSDFNVTEISRILQNEPTVLPLTEKQIQGYMTGFVDLICEHEGRYYVVDYKSNYLGELWSDYSGENLTLAMGSHNYGLQYYIYSLVLNLHLKTFVKDYDYDDHFGGVMYLFLRGMRPDVMGAGVFSTRPDIAIIKQLETLVTGGVN